LNILNKFLKNCLGKYKKGKPGDSKLMFPHIIFAW
jgi:hypothetical protein